MVEFEDVLLQPLTTIEKLYQQDPDILNNLTKVSQHFRTQLQQHQSNIPWYNTVPLQCLPANSVVRFRGMIQDMLDPEFYLATYSSTDTATGVTKMNIGAYTEPVEKANETIDFENSANVTLERQTYYCVPVPGENKWVGEMYVKNSTYVPQAQPASTTTAKKRALDEQNGMDVDTEEAPSNEKKMKTEDELVENGASLTNSVKEEKVEKFDANHPLPNGRGPTCYITLYSGLNDLKMNEVVEFVCVLDPTFHINNQQGDNHSDVARLHCLYYNRVPTLNLDVSTKSPLYQKTITELSTVRSEFMEILVEMFSGDAIAAEYFLLHLISGTYTVVGVLCVGKFCLNLTNTRCEGFAQVLYELVQKISEKSYCLPLTIDNLNKLKYTPKKDYEANRLVSGILQLSDDTNLVLDETQMQPGKLEADGVNNLKAIGNLIQWQNVEYDFRFSRVEMRTKANTLILSEGKSMLQCDCQLPLVPEEEVEIDINKVKTVVNNIPSTTLERIRIYLAVVRAIEYDLPEQVSQALQDDFVELRKEDPKGCSTEWFSSLLTVSRFMAMSYGLSVLDASLWTRTKELDAQRTERMVSKTNTDGDDEM